MDAVLLGRIVAGGAVIGATVVPNDDVAFAPDVMVFGVGLDHVAFEIGNQLIAFSTLGADDRYDFAGIEIERFAPGLGMRAQYWMIDRRPILVFRIKQFRLAALAAVGERAFDALEASFQTLRQRVIGRIGVAE